MTVLMHPHTAPIVVSPDFSALQGTAGAGCVEELNITAPRAVIDLHARHASEGARFLRTNTAGASPERLDRYRMHDEAFIVSYMAAQHARTAADSAGSDRRVMGVASLESHAPLIGFLPLARVEAAAHTMASGLVGGGADVLLVEAIQCPARLAAAVDGVRRGMTDAGRRVPIVVKLRYEPRFGCPARPRVTPDLARAAAAAAGLGVSALALAPSNLDHPYIDTLGVVAAAFPGALFIDLNPASTAWPEIMKTKALARRITLTSRRGLETTGLDWPTAANDRTVPPAARRR